MYIIVHGIKCFHMFLRWLEEHSLIDVVIMLCQRLYTSNPLINEVSVQMKNTGENRLFSRSNQK